MSLESVSDILLRGLAGQLLPTALHHLSPEAAYAELKRRTGEDFGHDVESWRAYLRAKVDNPEGSNLSGHATRGRADRWAAQLDLPADRHIVSLQDRRGR